MFKNMILMHIDIMKVKFQYCIYFIILLFLLNNNESDVYACFTSFHVIFLLNSILFDLYLKVYQQTGVHIT
jgi:hypothetical protein